MAEVRQVNASWKTLQERAPSIPSIAASEAWRLQELPSLRQTKAAQGVMRPSSSRSSLRVGIPRVLNFFASAPFFTAYLQGIGIDKESDRNLTANDRRVGQRGLGPGCH